MGEPREAGRELDALVAERVMGWMSVGLRARYGMLAADWRGHDPLSRVGPEFECAVPHYSTDIAAAWQVVEKVQASGHRVCLYRQWNGQYHCVFGTAFAPNFPGERHADTAPLAICLAALAVDPVRVSGSRTTTEEPA